VLSEYHDGGSPCGVFMLRQGRYKLVHFAEGHPPQLFDLETDPQELQDLAGDPGHAATLARLDTKLREIMDPEAVNRQAFEDQARMIESLGGIEAIRALPSFNHTPLDD
jgi:choline-sulfatase